MVAEVVASLSQTHPIARSAHRNHRKHHEEHEKNREKTHLLETADLASVSCEIIYA